jgi:hypothetical protein
MRVNKARGLCPPSALPGRGNKALFDRRFRMNEEAEKIVETLKKMGYRVVTLEDKSCMAYPVINISIVPAKWAQANYPGQAISSVEDA